MIVNAKDRLLSQNPGTLPDVSGALLNWFQSLTFSRVTKTVTDFKVVETKEVFSTKGVRQPMGARQLSMKPEGQRGWKWEQLHCLPDVILKLDDIVEFGTEKFRVLAVSDFREYGYMHYEIAQDYKA